MKKIALCGFMGCGKSTITQALSSLYNLPFTDTDSYIESCEKRSISEIFKTDGEAYFRDLEHEAIKKLCQLDTVLSLGGGAVMFDRNVDVLKHNEYQIVFINTDFDVIKNRLENDKTRPLLNSNDLKTLFDSRLSTYKKAADIEISCTNETADDIAKMIIEKTQ